MNRRINTISLFSGGGGLDLGFAAAGYRIVCEVDNDPFSCKTLELNAGKRSFFKGAKVIQTDVSSLRGEKLLKDIGLKKGEIDLIIGGPPCQAFSVNGQRKGLADPRGNLVWEFARIVKEIKPKAFLFENVAGLKTIHNGQLYQELLEDLSLNGMYTVSDHLYQFAEYGIPQFRQRIFFIGHKDGKRIPPMLPTHGDDSLFYDRPFVTVEKVLADLPKPGVNSGLANHVGREHSEAIMTRYKDLRFGERDSRTRINKLDPNRPSFTIVVGSDAGGGKGHVHPYVPREVTPRESARIQTFPDWWEFSGTGRHVIRQVGNAVPVLFGAIFGEYLLKYLFNKRKRRSYDELVGIIDLHFLAK